MEKTVTGNKKFFTLAHNYKLFRMKFKIKSNSAGALKKKKDMIENRKHQATRKNLHVGAWHTC